MPHLQFIVDHQFSHSLAVLVDMEPEYSLAQMMRVLPTMQEGMRHIMTGENPEVAAAAVVRIAMCHYLVRGHDRSSFLAELRHAAGLDPDAVGGVPRRGHQSASQPMILDADDVWTLQMKEVPDAVD